jgi:hypothetical protein
MRVTDSMEDPSGKSLDGLHNFQPRLIAGETKQAFFTSKFECGRTDEKPLPHRMSGMLFRQKLRFVQFLSVFSVLSYLMKQ